MLPAQSPEPDLRFRPGQEDRIPLALAQGDLAELPLELLAEDGPIGFTAKARYRIAARVLSRERYYRGWRSDLSPLDLALGWGTMSDPAVDRWIDWSQGGRWYFWQWSAGSPYQNDAIRVQSANVHVVPANQNLRRALLAVEEGDRVQLRGFLVDLLGPGGDLWNSSLSRSDKGNRSCEILYITELADDETVYR